ncbi:oligosaccharide flippase family protein [Rhodococcus sp. SJ-2]
MVYSMVAPVLDRPAGLVLTRILGAGLALLTSPLIARAIGPDGRGLTAAAITVLMMVPIALGLGLPWAVRQRAAYEDDVYSVLRTARIVSFFTLVPAVLLGGALVLTLLADMPGGAKWWLVIGLGLTPLVVQRNSTVSALVVIQDFRRISLVNLSQPVAFFIIIVALWLFGPLTVTTVVGAQSASLALGFATTAFLLPVSWRGARFQMDTLVRESVLASGAQISEIASYRLNQLILLPVIGSAGLGYYAVAINVALAPAPVGQAISSAVFTDIAEAEGDHRRQKILVSLQASFYLAVIMAMIIIALSPMVIPLAFGDDFSPAVPATMILAAGLVFVICNFVLTSCLVANGRSGAASVAQIAGFVSGVLLVFALGIPFELTGAAIASSVGFLVTAAYSSWALSIRPLEWVPRKKSRKAAFQILFARRN